MNASVAWLSASLSSWLAHTKSSRNLTQTVGHTPDLVAKRMRLSGDRGEGVISSAIAVLIIAFLGAAMWVGFQKMWQKTEARTNTQVEQIGSE